MVARSTGKRIEFAKDVDLSGRPDHREDADLDRTRQCGPCLDECNQVRVWVPCECDSCAGFCAALIADMLIFRGKRGGFESLIAHLVLMAQFVPARGNRETA